MSAVKCPFCEYRDFHPGDTCINCGALLPSQEPVAKPPSLKNRPPSRNRPRPREEQLLDSSQERVPRKRSLSREETSPLNKSVPREEQLLDSGQERVSRSRLLHREEPSPTNQPPFREEPSLESRPLPRKMPSSPQPISREDLSPPNKPLPSETSTPENRPQPRKMSSSVSRPISRENPSPPNKSLPSGISTPESRSPSRKMLSSASRPISGEDLSPPNKPLLSETSTPENRPRPGKEDIPSHKSGSKIETDSAATTDEPYLEDESYPEDELSSEHESFPRNDPYLVDQSYSEDELYSENGSHSNQLVPYHRQNFLAPIPNPNTALEPYQISAAMQEYLPASLLPDLSTLVKEEKQARPKPWETDKLPWGLPRRDPDIEGTIIQIQQSQELPDYPNIVVGIVNMLTELIWLLPNDPMRREEERLQITTVRIRTSDNEKRDARLIGYLRGANLTLGDDVWFWGWHRQGSLTVRKGYNWTSKAIISTHSMGLVIPALILLILMGIGFLLFLAWPSIAAGIHATGIHALR